MHLHLVLITGGLVIYKRFLEKIKLNPSVNQNHTIERIKVSETRNYIKIVLTNYYIYNSLYAN